VEIEDTETSFTVAWKGRYRIDGPAFTYAEKGLGRVRTILATLLGESFNKPDSKITRG